LRIESSLLEITPQASIRWHRDAEDNAVAIATFSSPASQLAIVSEVVIQQFNEAPLDFLLADEAAHYPFDYLAEDAILLSPYLNVTESGGGVLLSQVVGEAMEARTADRHACLAATLVRRDPADLPLHRARRTRGAVPGADPLAAFRFLPGLRGVVSGGGTAAWVGGAFCQRLPQCRALFGKFRSHPCLGGGLSAGRRLEGI